MRIDFRSEYLTLSVISFSLTFLLYVLITENISIIQQTSYVPIVIINFLVGVGLYVAIFRSLIFVYNKFLWKYVGYRHININGYWKYIIQMGEDQHQRIGYAIIKQDMYEISIYGLNAGGGNTDRGVAIWHSSDAYILHSTLHYDYDLFGERLGSHTRVVRGRSSVELIGESPKMMVGTFYNIPLHNDSPHEFGSLLFEHISSNDMTDAVKDQFAPILRMQKELKQ